MIKKKLKNWQFYLRILLITFLPILTAMGVEHNSITTWQHLGQVALEFVSNPYLVGLWLFTLYQSFVNTDNKEPEINGVS